MTASRWLRACLVTGTLIGASLAGPALAAPLTTSGDAIKIMFSGGVDPATGLLRGSPSLNATFPDGNQGVFIMDTGSAGMVVYNAGFSPPAGASPLYTNVIQAYKSDNLLFEGDVYNTLVEIGTPGNAITSNVPVLFASNQRCADPSQHCTPKATLRFMGVGFGEPPTGNTSWPINATARNPLFNVLDINGQPAQPTRGWIMSSNGITVGLTPANTQGFPSAGLEQLTSSADGFNRGHAAVVASPTSLGLGIQTSPSVSFNGTVLVDSGVSYAMMVLDSGATPPATIDCPSGPRDCTDAGYTITVYLGDPALPLIYQVITGANGIASASPFSAAAPDFVNQLTDTAPFWNTSFHFYNAYDYLFDSESGQVGYRTAAAASVPAPLPLAGAAAGLGWSRAVRRRLRRSHSDAG